MTTPSTDELLQRLNRETSVIAWQELQPFYDQDAVIVVSPEMDLVRVAVAMAEDDTSTVSAWLNAGQIQKISAAQHRHWQDSEARVWAVVVAPWVLVQGRQSEQ